ncbi:MAG: Ig-like domain-containing protein [Clostridia bacterium]|nr:Ig-like domain-containing protein [Clostridia bacterium]
MAKSLKGWMLGALCLASVFLFFSCGKGAGVEERAKLKISEREITLQVGERKRLQAWLEKGPDGYVEINWYSSDTAIATIEDGEVEGVAEGETVVFAQTKEYTVSCKVTVKKK